MIWICAYTVPGVQAETIDALHEFVVAPDAVRIIDVGHDDYAYGRLLRETWATGLDFAIVEHDIVIREDVVAAFHDCESGYCCFPYAWTTCVGPALGCTRFRGEFTARYPGAIDEALEMPTYAGEPGHWKQLDVYLMRRVLRDQHGEQPCVHLDPVEHLNPEQALRPDASPEPVLVVEGAF